MLSKKCGRGPEERPPKKTPKTEIRRAKKNETGRLGGGTAVRHQWHGRATTHGRTHGRASGRAWPLPLQHGRAAVARWPRAEFLSRCFRFRSFGLRLTSFRPILRPSS